MRGALPAAPDGNEKKSKWQHQWYVSAEINAFCSFSDCSQTPRSTHSQIRLKFCLNLWNIEPGTAKIHPDSTLSIKSMPNRREKLPKSIFKWFWRCILEVKIRRKPLDFSANSNGISVAFLHADFYWFSVVLGPQNVLKISTFSKFVWKG